MTARPESIGPAAAKRVSFACVTAKRVATVDGFAATNGLVLSFMGWVMASWDRSAVEPPHVVSPKGVGPQRYAVADEPEPRSSAEPSQSPAQAWLTVVDHPVVGPSPKPNVSPCCRTH